VNRLDWTCDRHFSRFLSVACPTVSKETVSAQALYSKPGYRFTMNRQYFEAILQLRNTSNTGFSDAIEFIEHETARAKRPDIFITKVEKVKGGLDFYMSSKKWARKLGETLIGKHGGEFQANPRLFSRNRQTSKDIYRLNVLVRLPAIPKGAVISIGDATLLVTGYGKGAMICRNLATGKTTSVNLADSYEVVESRIETRAVVTKKRPHVEVLDQVTSECTRLENVSSTTKDRMKILFVQGRAYAVD
jgi:NMD protein affecting ribosome stability and mRNA decay